MKNIENQDSSFRTNRLIISEWLSLAAIVVACFLFLLTEIRGIDSRIESRVQAQELRMQSQEQRSDRLYEMFIDLLKQERK